MIRVSALGVWLMAVVTCCGCATTSTVVTAEKAETKLTFIKADDRVDAYKQLYSAADTAHLNLGIEKSCVRDRCRIPEPDDVRTENLSLGGSVIGVAIGGLMKLFVG